MKYPIKISNEVSFPRDIATQTVAILAKRRAGKSYTMRRFAEQLLADGQQIVLVDPKGDQWGLRSSADGKKPGFPIVILGGEHGDLPLEEGSGELVAKLVAEERVSILLDLSGFSKAATARFMAVFLEQVYRIKALEKFRTPVAIIVDEADAIAPQKPQRGEERMLGAIEDIVRRGGQRGLGCFLITQRSAVLNKNVLTQAEMLVVLRTIAPQDLAAMKAWIDVHGTPEQAKELLESLPSLPIGDAWFWSPGWPTAEGIFVRSRALPITTFDSGATPKPGERKVIPKNLADVDLDALKGQMAETIEKAKAEDPKLLKKRIAELERDLENARKNPPKQIATSDPLTIERAVAKAIKERDTEWKQTLGMANKEIQKLGKMIGAATRALGSEEGITLAIAGPPPMKHALLNGGEAIVLNTENTPRVMREALTALQENTRREFEEAGGLTAPEKRILNAIAWLNSIGVEKPEKAAVAFIAEASPTSSSFSNNCSSLRTAGLIDYPEGGKLILTSSGGALAEPVEAVYDQKDLHTRVLARLKPADARMLEEVLEGGIGAAISKEDLAARTGASLTSSSFSNRLSYLKTLGLITYPHQGYVAPASFLFI